MTLVRWNPTREIVNISNEMDRVMESFFGAPVRNVNGNRWNLALDVSEDEEAFVVKALIPGVSADDIEIVLDDNVLSIQGEVPAAEVQEEGKHYHLRELRSGRFARSIKLPTAVNAEAIEATHQNGVLTLYIPKAEQVKPRRIQIKR